MQKISKLWLVVAWDQVQGGGEIEVGVTIKGWHGGKFVYHEVMEMYCITANILVVILCFSFERYYHWGKLGKMYTGPYFLKLYVNLLLSQI